MVIPLMAAALLAAADPAKAAAYFSPEALNTPVPSCGDQSKRPAINDIQARWYADVWTRAGEPSLAAAAGASPPTTTTWRFTDIPNLAGPTVFRISQEADGRLRMVAKRLSGQGGYDPGRLKDRVDRMLSADEQRRFQAALESVEVVLTHPLDTCYIVLDGDQLILERTQAGRYVIGQRFSEPGKPMNGMNDLLDGFAGWRR